MIIEIKIANYRSINIEQTLSFVAENARRHPEHLIPRKGYKLLKAAAIFGANASGKSNFVKAISAMSDFVRNSATRMNEGDPITAYEPFRLDPAMRDSPSRFEITFVTDNIIYVYGFAADRQLVHSEWLTAKRETTGSVVCQFRRDYNDTLSVYDWYFDGFKQSDIKQIEDRTLKNMLALSVGPQQNVEILRPTYRYMRENIWSIDMSGDPDMLIMQAARWCAKSEEMRQTLSTLLNAADTDIERIDIETEAQSKGSPTTAPSLFDIEPNMPEHVQNFFKAARVLAASTPLPHIVALRRDGKGNSINFDLQIDESQGTQRFFALVGPFVNALATGAFVVIDELDASMHPSLTRRLLELFQSAGANDHGAQLLFTTHDSSLLDQDLFRRDQIWLAEKCDGASTFFSLADIKPPVRNTESFLRNYLIGRYGGTPHLGRSFDDLAAGVKS